jgi:hypothetical protein
MQGVKILYLPCCFGEYDQNSQCERDCGSEVACLEKSLIAIIQEEYPNGDIFRGFA